MENESDYQKLVTAFYEFLVDSDVDSDEVYKGVEDILLNSDKRTLKMAMQEASVLSVSDS